MYTFEVPNIHYSDWLYKEIVLSVVIVTKTIKCGWVSITLAVIAGGILCTLIYFFFVVSFDVAANTEYI